VSEFGILGEPEKTPPYEDSCTMVLPILIVAVLFIPEFSLLGTLILYLLSTTFGKWI
jgi:hypothetical protein